MIFILQHITVEQLNELTDEQKERLREWWEPSQGDLFIWTENKDKDIETLHKYDGYAHENLSWHSEPPIEWIEDDKKHALPLLSIGGCIELLQDRGVLLNITNIFARINRKLPGWGVFNPKEFDMRSDELIVALWQATKKVL